MTSGQMTSGGGGPMSKFCKRRKLNPVDENKDNGNGTEGGKKRRRREKGTGYFTGLLTSPEGLKWVAEFEKDPSIANITCSSATINSQQGPITVNDADIDFVKEVANPGDYFTALREDIEGVIECPLF